MLLNSSRRKQVKPNRFDDKFGNCAMNEANKQYVANYNAPLIKHNTAPSSLNSRNRQTFKVRSRTDPHQKVFHGDSSLERAKKDLRRSHPIEKNDKSPSEFNSNHKRSGQDSILTSDAFPTVSRGLFTNAKIDEQRENCGISLKRQSPNCSVTPRNNSDRIFVETPVDEDDDNIGNGRSINKSVLIEKDQYVNSEHHCFKKEVNKTIIKRENSSPLELMPDDRLGNSEDNRRKISSQNCSSESPKNQSFKCGTDNLTEMTNRRSACPMDRSIPTMLHEPSGLDGNKVVSPTSAVVETPKFLSKNFPCQLCGTRFSNPNILEAHQSFYCSQRSIVVNQVTRSPNVKKNVTPENKIIQERPSSSLSNMSGGIPHPPPMMTSAIDESPPSTIFLPCLYTDSNVPMQIIGYPQTVIPVAVSKRYEKSLGAALSSKHVTLDAALLADLTVDVNHVIVPLKTNENTEDGRPKGRELSKPLHTTVGPEIFSNVLERKKIENLETLLRHPSPRSCQREEIPQNQIVKLPAPRSIILPSTSQNVAFLPAFVQQWKILQHGNRPTKNLPYPPVTTTGQTSPSQFLLLKAFPCPNCSASFSSQKTLDGHLNFYCLAKPQNPGTSFSISNNLHSDGISRSNSLNCLVSPTNADKEKNTINDQQVTKKPKLDKASQLPKINQSSSTLEPKSTKKRPLFLCEICRKAFREKLIFDNHKCDDDRTKLRSILSSNRLHRRHHDHYFRCKYCEYQSQYKGNLKRHVILVHRDETVGSHAASI